jgi:hypothetical protein
MNHKNCLHIYLLHQAQSILRLLFTHHLFPGTSMVLGTWKAFSEYLRISKCRSLYDASQILVSRGQFFPIFGPLSE